MKTKSILTEAEEIINGPRRKSYGEARQSFQRIAVTWTAVLNHQVTSEDVARCMIALKLIRDANKSGRDNLVDICGYAALLDQMKP